MSELLPCPFCGGEAELVESDYGMYMTGYAVYCKYCCTKVGVTGRLGESYEWTPIYDTEAEAIAAWNSRAPIEYDGWFYLPKPKEGIVDYGEPEITRTENGYKVRQIVDVVDEAARKWGDELGEYVMRRICEVWNSRAERTCEYIGDDISGGCSECRGWLDPACAYCPNCGSRVVGE